MRPFLLPGRRSNFTTTPIFPYLAHNLVVVLSLIGSIVFFTALGVWAAVYQVRTFLFAQWPCLFGTEFFSFLILGFLAFFPPPVIAATSQLTIAQSKRADWGEAGQNLAVVVPKGYA